MSLPQILLYLRLIFKKGPGVLKRLTHLQKVMDDQHPKIPHYYLQAVGARQEYQGLGIGSALIKHVTRLCDAENTPAYLESSSVKNLPLYERHGFETFAEHSFDDEGTTLWFMLREPQTANS
jgi:GNAT superfamily N-acetyltransferase